MVENIFMLYILALSTGGALAEVCEASLYTSSFSKYSVYCDSGCCGYYYSRECCPSYVGLIIGAVIGGLSFIGGIVFLICMCYHCNKRKSSVGTVISNNPTGPNTTVVGTTNQGVYYQTQPMAAYPAPGPNQAAYPAPGPYQAAYPAPGPNQAAYPAPGPNQPPTVAYPAPPPVYQPPGAGQSDPSSQDQLYPEKH